MRRRDLLGVGWLLLGLCGCATLQPERLSERLDTARACAEWRWIGITSGPAVQCPEAPGWTVKPLFGQVAPAVSCGEEGKGPDPRLIQELNRFCVYERTSRHKGFKHLPFPSAASADLVRVDQDCATLSVGDGEKASTADWKSHFNRFLEQAGKTDLPGIGDQPNVRLAFLDTHPAGKEVPSLWHHSGHGYALAHIARSLLCDPANNGRCAAQITTQLALPILEFDPKDRKSYKTDEKHGGYIGLQSHLAVAIQEELKSWQQDLERRGSPRRLVLNLSLAWDGDLFGGLDEEQVTEMKAGTQAVYRALELAASYDALVVAAAGNQKREPCSNGGLLLPAAWERKAPRDGCGDPPPPLVYAVGGVRADGDPLLNARSGRVSRSAYGENAVVPSSDPERPTVMYTGSSVAAAVVSSIAAAVWNYFPERTPYEIMGILDKSGDRQSATSQEPTAPRLSLSAALNHVCQDPGFSSLSAASFCSSLPSYSQWTPEKMSGVPGDSFSTLGSCQPWLYPQPEDPIQPKCGNDGCPPRLGN